MSGVRRRVSLVALVWLLSHVATLGVSFAGLCCTMPSTVTAVEDEDACCQGLAPGQICPLHKHGSHQAKPPAPSSPKPGDCVMRSGCDSAAMTLPALTLGLGLLPQVATVSDQTIVTVVTVEVAPPIARSVLPDLPPPRA